MRSAIIYHRCADLILVGMYRLFATRTREHNSPGPMRLRAYGARKLP